MKEPGELSKKQCRQLYNYLKVSGVCTKEELCHSLGLEYNTSNDRRIRRLVSIIAKRLPIISTSNQKGYRIALKTEDLDNIIHQWKELDSRIRELEERKLPLIKFYEANQKW